MKFCFWGNISGALNGSTVGGAELQISLIARALAMSGHEVVIVDPSSASSFVTSEGIRLVHVPGWNKGTRLVRMIQYRIPALWKVFERQKPDFYYVRMRTYLHLVVYLAAKKNKSKFITGIASDIDVMGFYKRYTYSYKKSSTFLRLLGVNIPNDLVFNFLLKRSDFILLQHQGQQFGSDSLRKRQAVFPNIIQSDYQFIEELPAHKYFIYVGSLTMLKGIDNLIKLMEIMDESIRIKIVGLPYGTTPIAIYEKMKARSNVELLGRKNHEETIRMISNSCALINVSHFEGFSNTFLEAWSVGVPVVSLNVNPGDLLNKFDLGFCCGGNLNKMKEVMESWDTKKFNREKLIHYVKENHDFENAADRLLRILKSQN